MSKIDFWEPEKLLKRFQIWLGVFVTLLIIEIVTIGFSWMNILVSVMSIFLIFFYIPKINIRKMNIKKMKVLFVLLLLANANETFIILVLNGYIA